MAGLLAATLLALCSIASWSLTGVVRRYALKHAMLDFPNARSSHIMPTPRGGGIAIACAILVGLMTATVAAWLPVRVAVALGGGGILVAALGWVDDRRGLAALPRLAAQALAAMWTVGWLQPSSLALTWTVGIDGDLPARAVAVILIVWMTNLYNFMDGIDGLAAGQALVAGALGGLLLALTGRMDLAIVTFLIAAAAGGFLPWNWAPAGIFMGDVSSGLLGYLFGTIAIAGAMTGSVPIAVALLLLGVFVFDATVTLMRRALRGDRWYAAHRQHAYQRLVQSGWSHERVSMAALGLALGVGGLATLATLERTLLVPALMVGTLGLASAYVLVERRRPLGEGIPGAQDTAGVSRDARRRSLT